MRNGPVDAHAVVGREQDERALGHRVAGAGDDDREGVREHPARQAGARGDEGDRVLRARGHHLQVVATGEHPRRAGDDDDRPVGLGPVQRRVEGRDDLRGDGVHLAVVQGQGGDAVLEVVADQVAHAGIPSLGWAIARIWPATLARGPAAPSAGSAHAGTGGIRQRRARVACRAVRGARVWGPTSQGARRVHPHRGGRDRPRPRRARARGHRGIDPVRHRAGRGARRPGRPRAARWR